MKAELLDVTALPFDRMELTSLPLGQLDVQIHLRCDAEAYRRLVEFFREHGFGRADRYGPPSSQKSLEKQRKLGQKATY